MTHSLFRRSFLEASDVGAIASRGPTTIRFDSIRSEIATPARTPRGRSEALLGPSSLSFLLWGAGAKLMAFEQPIRQIRPKSFGGSRCGNRRR